VIVLNSAEASIALLEKRSANYSGRPRVPSLEEYTTIQLHDNNTDRHDRQGWSNKLSIGIISTGVQMRKHRKMLQNALTPNNCLAYRDAQQEEAQKLVRRIIETPNEWIHHMQT
jgi:cytochrome P450